MPPLPNARHERFVQALFEGKPANKAYEEAGYSYNEGNAGRLNRNEQVKARLAELQNAMAEQKEMTVESLISELDALSAQATSDKQFSAAVRAVSEKIKLSGLAVQKVEVGGPGGFDTVDTKEELHAALVKSFGEQKAELFMLLSDLPAWVDVRDFAALRDAFLKVSARKAHMIEGSRPRRLNGSQTP